MEKTIVFALATGQKRFSSFLCKLVEKYAEILASQGQLSTAMEFLKFLGEDISPELVILRERITVSSQPGNFFCASFLEYCSGYSFRVFAPSLIDLFIPVLCVPLKVQLITLSGKLVLITFWKFRQVYFV